MFLDEIKSALKKNRVDNSKILINGVLFTCIILSLSSGFIDLVFFSGLSKSTFQLFGTLAIPAAIVYTVMSVGFTTGKFFCAMKIGMLNELKHRLKSKGKIWYKNLNKGIIPWHIIHKFLIIVSLITSISLSVISIGNGVRTMEQNIKNMTFDANNLLELNKSMNEGVKDKREAKKGNINATKNAQTEALAEFEKEWETVEACRNELKQLDETAEDYNTQNEIIRKRYSNKVALNGITWKNIGYAQKSDIKVQILAANKEFEVIDETSYIEESISFDKNAVEEALLALVDKKYKYPNGEVISFMNDDKTLVNIQTAISRLQQGISAWQSDTGDAGASSKVFTLIATYIKAEESAGGMGISEIMLMVLIAVFGIVQEFLIALFTPKSNIDRALLSQVSNYLEWGNEEEKERFLISVYKDYVGDGIINKEEFETKCKKCVELMEETEDTIIEKYTSKKPNLVQLTTPKTIEEIVKPKEEEKPKRKRATKKKEEKPKEEKPKEDVPKEEKEYKIDIPVLDQTVTITEVPKEVLPEKNNKIFVKTAERELNEMIGES